MKTLKILVTGAGGGVGQGIIKALRLITDLPIYIVSADMSSTAAGLYGGDISYLVPSASDTNYYNNIEKICIDNQIDYYFPGTDVELFQCANLSEKLLKKSNTITVVCPKSVIDIADDKYNTVQFLEDNNIAAPKTYLSEHVDFDNVTFPVIIKPRIGCRSIGVSLVNNKEEALLAIQSLDSPVIQEYINGDEYTCTIVIVDGNVSPVLCLKRTLRAGDTFRAFPEKNKIIEDYVKKIAVKLGILGSCNFQLRVQNGQPKLFEINSRFSGTTPFCAQLGFNPVEYFVKKSIGVSYNPEINYDAVVVRHWSEVVIHKDEISNLTVGDSFIINPLHVSALQHQK